MRRAIAAAAAAAVALTSAGCAGSGGDDGAGPRETAVTTVERTTTVEVVRGAGGGAGDGDGFDPAAIYRREAPGVVTVFSVMAGAPDQLGGGDGQGLGSGFVLNERGEIATNAHVVTEGEGRAIRRAREVYVAFADGNQVSARIVGFDPNADVALLRIDPAGLTLPTIRADTWLPSANAT